MIPCMLSAKGNGLKCGGMSTAKLVLERQGGFLRFSGHQGTGWQTRIAIRAMYGLLGEGDQQDRQRRMHLLGIESIVGHISELRPHLGCHLGNLTKRANEQLSE